MTRAPCTRRAGELNFVQKSLMSAGVEALSFLGLRHVDLVTGGFNGAAWRRPCGNDRKFTSIIREAVADTDLPMPPASHHHCGSQEACQVCGRTCGPRSMTWWGLDIHLFFCFLLCFCNSCHTASRSCTCSYVSVMKNKDCLILGIKIRCKDEGTGVVHTNWNSLLTRWRVLSQGGWESCKGWENFVKAAEEPFKKSLQKKEENKETQGWNRTDEQEEKGEQEKERKNKMKERNKLRNWDPSCRNQIRVQIMGKSNLVVNWMISWSEVQKTQNLLDKTDIRPMAWPLGLVSAYKQGLEWRDWSFHTWCKEKGSQLEFVHHWRKEAKNWSCQSVFWWGSQQARR